MKTMNINALLLTLSSLSQDELDDILNERDENPFDTAWCQANDIVEGDESHPEQEVIFKMISNATKHHEISSYLIDDINLVYRAGIRNIENMFINHLNECYEQGIIPRSWRS